MAHECPECGLLCHCCGDIDDIMLDTEESYLNCKHFLSSDCVGYEGDENEEEEVSL